MLPRIDRWYVIVLLLWLIGAKPLAGQDLSAWVNPRNEFHLFHDSTTEKLEHLPIQEYKVGWHHLLYVDQSGRLMVWHDGRKIDTRYVSPEAYAAGYEISLIASSLQLVAVRQGTLHVLNPTHTGPWWLGPDLVAYQNRYHVFEVFYQGQTRELEPAPPKRASTSVGTLAYVDHLDQFKAYALGQRFTIEDRPPKAFQAGKGVVSYVDDFDMLVSCRFDPEAGTAYTELGQDPIHFKQGWNAMLWLDAMQRLHLYQNQNDSVILEGEPLEWAVKDNVAMFQGTDEWTVVVQGNNFVRIGPWMPEKWIISGNIFAYLDLDRKLKAVIAGQVVEVSDKIIDDFRIDGQVIRWVEDANDIRFYYNGKRY